MYLGGFFIEQRCRKPPFCGRFRIPEKVRFRFAALGWGASIPLIIRDWSTFVMGFSLLSEMEFFAVPKNGISLNI